MLKYGFFVVLILFTASVVYAADCEVSRSLPDTVSSASCFTVTLTMEVNESNPPVSMGLTEYYPSGWNVSNVSLNGCDKGNRIEWLFSLITTPVKDYNITYIVHVPSNASGSAVFSGTVDVSLIDPYAVEGDSEVIVEEAVLVNVTRILPVFAYPESNVSVTLLLDVNDSIKPNSVTLVEHYPSGWSVSNVSLNGTFCEGNITWVFGSGGYPVEDYNISYILHVPESVEGVYNFTGVVDWGGGLTPDVAGDSSLLVMEPPVVVSRDLPASAYRDSSFTVTLSMSVDVNNTPESCVVTEYYPSGWSVSEVSLNGSGWGDRIMWVFGSPEYPIQNQDITYVVTVPSDASGMGVFSGTVDYGSMVDPGITGDSGVNILEGCVLPGDNPPCGVVTLGEVVDYINLWAGGEADLSNVIDLINVWASG